MVVEVAAPERLMNVKEVAEYLGVCPRTVWTLRAEGNFAPVTKIGKKRLVLDLSCRRRGNSYFIVTDRWQKYTEVAINEQVLMELSSSCDEFLIHAADVEGKCAGVEIDLVDMLGRWSPLPTTYAGGIRHKSDIECIRDRGNGRLDFTIGSALDIFGGSLFSYEEAVALGRK